MNEKIQVHIDGVNVEVEQGTTILEAAHEAGSSVPVLCYSNTTTANGLCRLCVVETEGERGMQAACVSQAKDGAVIQTQSENLVRVRRTILEMLAASVDLSESPELQDMLSDYAAKPERFHDPVRYARSERRPRGPILHGAGLSLLCGRDRQFCLALHVAYFAGLFRLRHPERPQSHRI